MKTATNLLSIILLLAINLLLPACNKSKKNAKPKGEYYLKCDFNGKTLLIDEAVWNAGEFEKQMDNALGKKVFTYSLGASNLNGESISLGFASENSLSAPANYSETLNPFGADGSAMLIYLPELSSQSYNSINVYDLIPHIIPMYPNVPRNVTISITEYNSTFIKGTFSGIVYPYNDDFEPILHQKIEISNGEFKLKLP